MRKVFLTTLIMIVLMASLLLPSCGKPVFRMSENTEKAMTIEAKNAKEGEFFTVGTLVVADGEEISIASNIEKGSVTVEIIGMPEDQSVDEVPDVDGEPVLTAHADDKNSTISGTVNAGDYLVKATVAEKATGTVQISVAPAE